jgi:vanillate/3-O-methylgallate O-demethylase
MQDPLSQHLIPHSPMVPVDPMTMKYDFAFGGFSPAEYTSWMDESLSWKEACYIGDWSFLAKYRFTGPDALKLFSDASINSFAKFAIGQAKHCVMCNEDGKVMAEGVLMRNGDEDFLYTGGPNLIWASYLLDRGDYDANAEEVGTGHFMFQVSGPKAVFAMERATGEDLRDIKFMRFRDSKIAGKSVQLLRQGMAGELGYEVHGAAEDAIAVYEAVFAAGQEFGMRRLGVRAFGVNHVEASFATTAIDYCAAIFGDREKEFLNDWVMTKAPEYLYIAQAVRGSFSDSDISELYRSPIELGWGKSIKTDHDFIGRDALEAELADPPRKIVTLEWNGDDVLDLYAALFRDGDIYELPQLPRAWSGIVADRVSGPDGTTGVSTSACYSVFFRKMLSLCVIDTPSSDPGTQVTVLWGDPGTPQKEIRATVAPAPYKQDNRRLDVTTLPKSS